jgi:DNA-binding transcriptional LysR family regulator
VILDKILRQFIEVAMFKNVSHAANKLCLSQPTLTHNMKKLEENLGVQLLVRTSTGVKTTEYGDLLLEQAQMMQRIYENTLSKLALIKARQVQSLRMGTGHAWWHMFVRDSFNTYRTLHPTVNIHIDQGNHLRLMDLLLGGDIDLFIGHEIQGLNSRAGITFVPLFSVTDSLFVRRGHPLGNNVIDPFQLQDYPCVELTPDEGRFQHMVEDMQPKRLARNQMHLEDRVIWSTNSMMAAIDMVNDSDAIMLSYPTCMADYFARYGIIPLQTTQQSPRYNVGFYMMREKMDAAHVVQMQALMQEHLARVSHLLV